MLRRTLVGMSAALTVLLAATTASADDRPLRLWSFSTVKQGAGKVKLDSGSQLGGLLQKRRTFGGAAFAFPESNPREKATGALFSTASGKSYSVLAQAPSAAPSQRGFPMGGLTHLDQFQAYEKTAKNASLRLTIASAFIDAIDANHALLPSECPPRLDCNPVRGIVRFDARAYANSAGGDFFSVGGVAYLEGHEGRWFFRAATSADSRRPLWDDRDFSVDDDFDDLGTQSHAIAELAHKLTLSVPLKSVREGELFAVHVSLDAEAIDARGRESAVEAFIQDPQKLTPALVKTKGLRARGKPRFREPAAKAPPVARCSGGVSRKAGRLQLSQAKYVTDESTGVPMFALVTRSGGRKGKASVTVTTRAGTAESGRDYRKVRKTFTFAGGDASPRLVEIPIVEDPAREDAETLTLSLSHPRCAKLGAQRAAGVTIADDDTPVEQPPSFTIGGTVDGLQGSGLVLTDLGSELTVAGNGPFTLPGTRADGLPYDVRVRTQPRNPDQVCTVSSGQGTLHGNVSNVAVHCAAPTLPPGLDATFGSGGRVSTPVGAGKAEAVLIQKDGRIVTAGRRVFNGGMDFALTRHDSHGNLDTSFGTGGIVTTNLGTASDEAFDMAADPNGGFVVVGRSDATGTNRDFGVVRYTDEGKPDARFDGDGIVTTDFAGQPDQANAVAVQPDGKIVVAGQATTGGSTLADGDFALARYNTDGTPDDSFDGDGLVLTDLGTKADAARAVAIRPDGRIVVAGTADGDVALVRYTDTGEVDESFGDHGERVTDFGSDDFANGIALTGDGHILVAGHTLGAGLNLDFALARYTSEGELDTPFGTGGIVKTDFGGDDFAENLTVQPDGKIVVVGRDSSATILDMAVVRYQADGKLDTGFGAGGKVTADFHGKGEFGQDVAIQPDGKIVAAGYTANGTDLEFALIRITP